MLLRVLIASVLPLASAGIASAQETPAWEQTDPRYGLLSPIPDRGAVPPIVDLAAPGPKELAWRAAQRRYRQVIRGIRHEHLGKVRLQAKRDRGIAALRELTDPAAFAPLVEELAGEAEDVRLAVLDHLAAHGDEGQAALAWTAIHDGDPAIRHEARRRLVTPASRPVLGVLDAALRSPVHEVANNAGTLAGALGAVETIPLLIFAQATADPVDDQGDLAWIAVATQRAFVAGVQPVVGDAAGAFQLIPGVVQEGTILRVVDAVAIFYRTEIHRSLVSLTTDDWGRSTAHLGYDMKAWWTWYNEQYVPFKNGQRSESSRAGI